MGECGRCGEKRNRPGLNPKTRAEKVEEPETQLACHPPGDKNMTDLAAGWGKRVQGGYVSQGGVTHSQMHTVEGPPCCSAEWATGAPGGMLGDSWGLQGGDEGIWAWGYSVWGGRSMGGLGDDGAGGEGTRGLMSMSQPSS